MRQWRYFWTIGIKNFYASFQRYSTCITSSCHHKETHKYCRMVIFVNFCWLHELDKLFYFCVMVVFTTFQNTLENVVYSLFGGQVWPRKSARTRKGHFSDRNKCECHFGNSEKAFLECFFLKVRHVHSKICFEKRWEFLTYQVSL